MVETFILESTQCPRCQGGLTSKSGQLNCNQCHIRFPETDGVPWLFAYPDAALGDWRHRIQYQLQLMMKESADIEGAAASAPSAIAKQRLNAMALGVKSNLRVLAELLKPIAVQSKASVTLLQAVKSQLPLSQKLMGYYANLHRDWCWGEKEHQATMNLIERVMGPKPHWGKTLVLGAGAGRLPYDIAAAGAEAVVALDINPLLVLFGKKMTDGHSIKYFEFPISPTGAKQAAVEGECRAKGGPAKNLHWIFGDGLNPPFKENFFDVVVTPWFIDVVPQDLHPLSDQINRLLKPGGKWLNFGPYGFHGATVGHQYSAEEVLEIVGRHGFKLDKSEFADVPYLQSPYSSQQREEKILGFSAQKESNQPKPVPYRQYPEWLEQPSMVVPKVERLHNYMFATEVQFQALSLIDGKKTMEEIAKEFASKHRLSNEDALGAVVSLFRQLLDGN